MKRYTSPSGSPIIAVLEVVRCHTPVAGIDGLGNPVYTGDGNVIWDTQTPVSHPEGGLVWVAEDGSQWPFHKLVFAGSERSEPHGYCN